MVASTMASIRELSVFSMVALEALLLFFFCNAVKQAEHSLKQSIMATYESVIDSWSMNCPYLSW